MITNILDGVGENRINVSMQPQEYRLDSMGDIA